MLRPYICEKENIEVGELYDFALGTVENVQYFTKEEVPYPLEKTKLLLDVKSCKGVHVMELLDIEYKK